MAKKMWRVETDGQRYYTQMEMAPEDARVLGYAVRDLDQKRGLVVQATIAVDSQNRPVISSIHIEGTKGRHSGITANDLRSFALGDLLSEVATEVAALKDERWRQIAGLSASVSALIADASESSARRSPNRIPDAKLRRVAELYLAEQEGGPGLRQRILHRMKMPPTAEPTIRYWIQRARADGWLSAPQHGSRGAVPGQKLIDYRNARSQKGKS